MEPLIITVAAVGAELTKEQQPHLPITPDELARDAAACRDAGASIYHLHVRDETGSPTMDVGTFRAALDAITSATDLIVQFTSGGAVTDTEDMRIAPLELGPRRLQHGGDLDPDRSPGTRLCKTRFAALCVLRPGWLAYVAAVATGTLRAAQTQVCRDLCASKRGDDE